MGVVFRNGVSCSAGSALGGGWHEVFTLRRCASRLRRVSDVRASATSMSRCGRCRRGVLRRSRRRVPRSVAACSRGTCWWCRARTSTRSPTSRPTSSVPFFAVVQRVTRGGARSARRARHVRRDQQRRQSERAAPPRARRAASAQGRSARLLLATREVRRRRRCESTRGSTSSAAARRLTIAHVPCDTYCKCNN